MVGEDFAGRVEVIAVDKSDLRISKISNKFLKSTLFNPRGALEAGGGFLVDDIFVVTGWLHDGATFLSHGFNEGDHVVVSLFAGDTTTSGKDVIDELGHRRADQIAGFIVSDITFQIVLLDERRRHAASELVMSDT